MAFLKWDLPRDSFFLPAGWIKGVCWINGFNIGRYWRRGPQQTLYVPKPLFRKGSNEIILLELDCHDCCTVEFLSSPVLDQVQDGKSEKE